MKLISYTALISSFFLISSCYECDEITGESCEDCDYLYQATYTVTLNDKNECEKNINFRPFLCEEVDDDQPLGSSTTLEPLFLYKYIGSIQVFARFDQIVTRGDWKVCGGSDSDPEICFKCKDFALDRIQN